MSVGWRWWIFLAGYGRSDSARSGGITVNVVFFSLSFLLVFFYLAYTDSKFFRSGIASYNNFSTMQTTVFVMSLRSQQETINSTEALSQSCNFCCIVFHKDKHQISRSILLTFAACTSCTVHWFHASCFLTPDWIKSCSFAAVLHVSLKNWKNIKHLVCASHMHELALRSYVWLKGKLVFLTSGVIYTQYEWT